MNREKRSGLSIGAAQIAGRREMPARDFLLRAGLGAVGAYGAAGCFFGVFQPGASAAWVFGAIVFAAVLFAGISLLKKQSRWIVAALAAFAAFLLAARVPFVEGFVATLNRATAFYKEVTHRDFLYFMPENASGLEPAVYTTIFWSLACFLLTFLLVWAVSHRFGGTLFFAVTAPFPFGSVVVGVEPPAVPFAALLFCWLSLLLLAGARGGRRARDPAGFWAPATALLLVAAGVFLIFPRAAYHRSPDMQQIRTGVETTAARLFPPSPQYRTEVRLNQEGYRRFTGRTDLRVQTSERAPLYLHSFSAGIYEGNRWAPLPETQAMPGDLPFHPLNMAAEWMEEAGEGVPHRAVSIRVENIAADAGLFYTPYGLATKPEELDHALAVQDAAIQSTRSRGARNYVLRASLADYRGLSALQRVGDPTDLQKAQSAYEAYVRDQYLQLPAELKPRLLAFCDEQGLLTTRVATEEEVAESVEAFLSGFGTYSLEPGPTPEGADFTEYFLTESQKGYCVHYATAAVLLLRACGVPARYAEGYVVPEEDFDGEGWAVVTDRRAHAWAEIYCPGTGWQVLDATPGFSSVTEKFYNNMAPGGTGETTPESGGAPSDRQEGPLPDEEKAPKAFVDMDSPRNKPWHVLLMPLYMPFIFLSLAEFVIWRRNRVLKRRADSFNQKDRNCAALQIHRYLKKMEPYAGEPPERIRRIILKATFGKKMISEDERQRLLDGAEAAVCSCLTLPVWYRFYLKYWKCLL